MRRERLTFGDFTLDIADRHLARDGRELPLAPKALDLLVHIVRRAGHLVSREDLVAAVWPDGVPGPELDRLLLAGRLAPNMASLSLRRSHELLALAEQLGARP